MIAYKCMVLHILLQVCKETSEDSSSFACMFCYQSNALGVFRYCVEMTVAAYPDEAVFVKFLW
ncbi:unnamed protein product [Brassica oleracea]|uniref:Uncharacterized protein n=1 Tax=Brassica oleracea TaxID=3712 RepID=A0A3P6F6Z7_BRAOL|nr:unnamed protein product [Brassica oleracea]